MDSTLKDELQALSSRHLTMSVGTLAIMLLILGVFSYAIYRMNVSFEKSLTAFQESQKTLNTRLDTMEKNLSQQSKEREAITKRQESTKKTIDQRTKETATTVAEVTKPDLDTQQVAYLAKRTFKLDYDPLLAEKQGLPYIGFQKGDVQQFMKYGIENDTLKQNLVDTNKLYDDEQKKSASFAQSANEYKESLTQCQTTLVKAKEVVGLTKRQKFFSAVRRWGTYGLIAYGAYEVGAH